MKETTFLDLSAGPRNCHTDSRAGVQTANS